MHFDDEDDSQFTFHIMSMSIHDEEKGRKRRLNRWIEYSEAKATAYFQN
jgi:hypothetical protein